MKVRKIISLQDILLYRKPKRIRQRTRIRWAEQSFSVQKTCNLISTRKHVWKWNFRKNSITTAPGNIRSIDLTKDVQEPHEDSYKNMLKDMKDLNKWRDIFMDKKSQYQKDVHSSQNVILIQCNNQNSRQVSRKKCDK